jgi:hypothetical protein
MRYRRGGYVRMTVNMRPRTFADTVTATPRSRRNLTIDVPCLPRTPSSTTVADGLMHQVDHEDKNYMLEFKVSDNGPGIPFHLQGKVFEPFIQAEMHLSKAYEGVGLGLSICRQIIKMLGGTISLESQEGEGTTFTMQVPVNMKVQSSQEPVEEKSWGKNNRPLFGDGLGCDQQDPEETLRILVAEDNPTNRAVILKMLNIQKFTGK